MVTKTKLTIGAIITLALAMSGTYFIAQDDDAYHCESRNIVMICEKLSSGIGTRCYYDDTYKICSEGWVKFKIIENEIPKETSGTKWLCSPVECVKIDDGVRNTDV